MPPRGARRLAGVAGAEERAVSVVGARERAHRRPARRCTSRRRGNRSRCRTLVVQNPPGQSAPGTRHFSSQSAVRSQRAPSARETSELWHPASASKHDRGPHARNPNACEHACQSSARTGVVALAPAACASAETSASAARGEWLRGIDERLQRESRSTPPRSGPGRGPHELERALRRDLADQHRELRRRDAREAREIGDRAAPRAGRRRAASRRAPPTRARRRSRPRPAPRARARRSARPRLDRAA